MVVTHFQKVVINHFCQKFQPKITILGEIPPPSMATTIDDGLSSGREGLSEGEIKPQKLKRMKNHLGLALNLLLIESSYNCKGYY